MERRVQKMAINRDETILLQNETFWHKRNRRENDTEFLINFYARSEYVNLRHISKYGPKNFQLGELGTESNHRPPIGTRISRTRLQ